MEHKSTGHSFLDFLSVVSQTFTWHQPHLVSSAPGTALDDFINVSHFLCLSISPYLCCAQHISVPFLFSHSHIFLLTDLLAVCTGCLPALSYVRPLPWPSDSGLQLPAWHFTWVSSETSQTYWDQSRRLHGWRLIFKLVLPVRAVVCTGLNISKTFGYNDTSIFIMLFLCACSASLNQLLFSWSHDSSRLRVAPISFDIRLFSCPCSASPRDLVRNAKAGSCFTTHDTVHCLCTASCNKRNEFVLYPIF